jgi:hypothetical protein
MDTINSKFYIEKNKYKDFQYKLFFVANDGFNTIKKYRYFLCKTVQDLIEIINIARIEEGDNNKIESRGLEIIKNLIKETSFLGFSLQKNQTGALSGRLFSEFYYNPGIGIWKPEWNIETLQHNDLDIFNDFTNHIHCSILISKKYNENIIELIANFKHYYKTNRTDNIIIFKEIEDFIGYKIKNDSFINRDFLNEKIVKMSLDNSNNPRGILLTKNDFDNEINSKYNEVQVLIKSNPYPKDMTRFIYDCLKSDEENAKIFLEERNRNKLEEQQLYPWKTLDDISYPEFIRKPIYFNLIDQLIDENEEIQQLRHELKLKWDLFQISKQSYRLPIEINKIIKDILVT